MSLGEIISEQFYGSLLLPGFHTTRTLQPHIQDGRVWSLVVKLNQVAG